MSCIPASSGFNGGTISNPLTLATTDPVGNDILRIQAPAGYHQTAGDGYLLHIFAGDGTDVLNFDPSGALFLSSAAEEPGASLITLTRGDDPSGETTTIRSQAGVNADRITCATSGSAIFRVNAAGAIYTAAHAAPADADVSTGQCALWFDQTPAATKLMVKAKDSNGTVKTASIVLV